MAKHSAKNVKRRTRANVKANVLKTAAPNKDEAPKVSSPKTNNYLLAAVAIIAIVIIVWLALSSKSYSPSSNSLVTGNVIISDTATGGAVAAGPSRLCKFIAAPTTIYDENSLSVTLGKGASTYYSGNTITVEDITTDGCILNVGGSRDFLAVGQVQRLGTVYITIKEVVE
jgi:hypothetical protein